MTQLSVNDFLYKKYGKSPNTLADGLMTFLTNYPSYYTLSDRLKAFYANTLLLPLNNTYTLLDLENMYYSYLYTGNKFGLSNLSVSDVKLLSLKTFQVIPNEQGEYLDAYTDVYPEKPKPYSNVYTNVYPKTVSR